MKAASITKIEEIIKKHKEVLDDDGIYRSKISSTPHCKNK